MARSLVHIQRCWREMIVFFASSYASLLIGSCTRRSSTRSFNTIRPLRILGPICIKPFHRMFIGFQRHARMSRFNVAEASTITRDLIANLIQSNIFGATIPPRDGYDVVDFVHSYRILCIFTQESSIFNGCNCGFNRVSLHV